MPHSQLRFRLPSLLIACFAASCSLGTPEVSLSVLENRGERPLGDDYRVVTDEAYGPHDRQRMDLYLAKDVERLGSRDFTIVFLHGGGFSFGDKANNQRYIKFFLQKGLNVVNMNYRIREGIPRATEDLALALNHLVRHAGEHGLRLNKVVVGGFSAGGADRQYGRVLAAGTRLPIPARRGGPDRRDPQHLRPGRPPRRRGRGLRRLRRRTIPNSGPEHVSAGQPLRPQRDATDLHALRTLQR